MKRTLIVLCLILALLAVPLTACAKEAPPLAPTPAPAPAPAPAPTPAPAPAPAPAPEKPIVLTFAWNDTWGPLCAVSQLFRPGGIFAKMLAERSNGRLQVNVIPRMFETGEPLFIAIQEGKADLADVSYPYMTGTYPLWAWEQVPGTVDSADLYEACAESAAIYRDPAVREFLRGMYREHGVEHIIGFLWSSPGGVFNNIGATTIAELQTLKTRAYGYYIIMGFKELGVPAVYLPSAEVPGAILAGTIDASYTNFPYGYTMGWHTVTEYITLVPFSAFYSEAVFMNAKVYDGLPDDLKVILKDVCDEVTDLASWGTVAESVIVMNAMEEQGLEMLKLKPAEHAKAVEKLKIIEEEFIKEAGPKGAEILRLAREAVAKYRAIPEYPKP